MKFVITGYYDKNNYGDDLFKEIATTIFIDKNKNEKKYNDFIDPNNLFYKFTFCTREIWPYPFRKTNYGNA